MILVTIPRQDSDRETVLKQTYGEIEEQEDSEVDNPIADNSKNWRWIRKTFPIKDTVKFRNITRQKRSTRVSTKKCATDSAS